MSRLLFSSLVQVRFEFEPAYARGEQLEERTVRQKKKGLKMSGQKGSSYRKDESIECGPCIHPYSTSNRQSAATSQDKMSPEIPHKRVWTTLITNTAYLPGLLALEYSLRLVNSKYPLVALYTSTFPAEGHAALDARGIAKLEVKYLLPVSSKDYTHDPRFYDCWSKLQPFGLEQFDRVVQLDSDMIVIKNMDELFDIELGDNAFAAGWACVCNPMKFEHYPRDWIADNCAFTGWYDKLGDRDGEIVGPEVKDQHGLMICNGGLQVVEPNKENYDKIIAKMDDDLDYDFADQSLLSDVFKDKWIGLSFGYNYLKTMRLIHQDLKFDAVKNIHYILTPKPWNVDRSFDDDTDTFAFWWDINDKRLEEEKIKGIADGF